MVREGRVLIPRSGSSPNTQFASDYRVKVCEPGALVSAASSSTTITVHPGHGFSAGDKFIVGTDTARYRTVTSVTSTTVVVSAAVSVASGEFLINIGADTGSSGPEFDSTPVQVYLDSGYVSAPANSTVSTDSVGRYRYWHKGIARWELVLTSTGTPVAFYTDTDSPADEDQVSYGVRYAHLFATSGTGTDSDPWTGWESAYTSSAGLNVHHVAGHFKGNVVLTDNGVTISGSGPYATFWESDETAESALQVDLGENNANVVTIKDICFEYTGTSAMTAIPFVNISETNRSNLHNVSILANSTSNVNSSAVGLAMKDLNVAWVHDLHVRGFESPGGFWGVGIDLGNGVTENRGNMSFFGGWVERCNTAIRIAKDATNMVNNIQFFGTKMRHSTGTGAGFVPRVGTIGFDLYSQAFLVNLYGVHVEWYETSVSAASITGLTAEGCIFQGWGNGTTGAVLLDTCDHVRIQNNLFNNPVAALSGVYAIELSATSQNYVTIGPNRYVYSGSFTTEPNGLLNNALTSSAGNLFFDTTNKWQFRDLALLIGRGIDENLDLNFAVATGVAQIRWDNANSRFSFSRETYIDGILRTAGAFIGGTRVDVGTFFRLPTSSAVTIASGIVTVTTSNHTVTGEGGVADDLVTINGGVDGQMLYLRPTSDTVDITVKHGTGNIFLTGAADLVMDRLEDTIALLFNGTNWVQVGGGNNRA